MKKGVTIMGNAFFYTQSKRIHNNSRKKDHKHSTKLTFFLKEYLT